MKGQKGFTLIELMIVVAIIGVLSAIAIPAYKNYVAKSEMASAMATMKALVTPAELAMQADGNLSAGLSTLGISSGSNTLGTIGLKNQTTSAAIITFRFSDGSLANKGVDLARGDDGWTCIHDTGIEVDGCNSGTVSE